MADFFDKVSFANKISTVLKASSDDDTPIPGYLYKDICDISFESDGSSLSLVEFLTNRLEKKSPNVKLKVLKLLKYVVEHGHPTFGHCLRKDATGISEATKYGGVDDVLTGKAHIHAIRKAAQELSEYLFDAEASLSSKKETPHMKSTGGMGPAQTGSKMQGFGNSPAPHNKTIGDTIIDGLSKLADKLSDDSDSQKRALLSSFDNPTGLYNPIQLEGESHVISAQKAPVPKVTPPRHIPGRAGGGWEEEEPTAPSVFTGPWKQKSPSCKSAGSEELSDALDSLTIETHDAWLGEQEVVTAILQGSSNPLPPRSEINSFLKSCTSLNCDKIVEFLNRQLPSCDDTVVMRCLLIIEAVMRSDLFNLEQLVTVIEANLVTLYDNREGMVKAKSRKIIRILEKLTTHTQILTSNIIDTNGLTLQSFPDKTMNSSSSQVSPYSDTIYSNADDADQQSSYEPPFLLSPDMEETESMSHLSPTERGITDFLKPET